MKRKTSILCAALMSSIVAQAATNPLGANADGYLFSVPVCTNRLEGVVMGYPPAYRTLRIEDMDYLAEAARERASVLAYTIAVATGRVAVIGSAGSIHPSNGGGVLLKDVDVAIAAIKGSGSLPPSYAKAVPSFSPPAVSPESLNRNDVLLLASNSVHVVTAEDLSPYRHGYSSIADATNRFAMMDNMFPCVTTSPVNSFFASNRIVGVYSLLQVTNGAEKSYAESPFSSAYGISPITSVSQEFDYSWRRESEDSQWSYDGEWTGGTRAATTNILAWMNVSAIDVGIVHAITGTPARVKNPQAVLQFAVAFSDVTEDSRIYVDVVYEHEVVAYSSSTNYVYVSVPAEYDGGARKMAAQFSSAKMDEVLAACGLLYMDISDAAISHVPTAPSGGGYGGDALSDTFRRKRTVSVSVIPETAFFFFETKFRTSLNQNSGGN